MRNLKQFMLFVMIGSLVTLTSCSSNDDGGDGGNAGAGTVTAKVNGASFTSLEISTSATLIDVGGSQSLIIIASNSAGQAIQINISGVDGIGTYNITGADILIINSASYSETDVSDPANPSTEIWQAPYDDTLVGFLKISELTETNIKGTFEFSCKNVLGDNSINEITDGSYNIGL